MEKVNILLLRAKKAALGDDGFNFAPDLYSAVTLTAEEARIIVEMETMYPAPDLSKISSNRA